MKPSIPVSIMLQKLHGKHLITIEGLGTPEHLHPIQKVMYKQHSLQCGYCSPGFVMSLFALLANSSHPDEEEILASLEEISVVAEAIKAFLEQQESFSENFTTSDIIPDWCRAIEPRLFCFKDKSETVQRSGKLLFPCTSYLYPKKSIRINRYFKK